MKKYIIFNWKCNPSDWQEAKNLLTVIKSKPKFLKKYDVFVATPFVYLEKLAKEKGIKTCAQDCFWEQEGPFTGEVSPLMIKNLDCDYVLLGHSERKRIFGETERTINKKLKAVLDVGLCPILFFGELKQMSQAAAKKEIVSQLGKLLAGVEKKFLSRILFVYEPAFAVSTQGNKVLSSRRVKEKTGFIRRFLRQKFPFMPEILYGGSVDGSNIKDYLSRGGVEGVVVGQASLNLKQVKKIISAGLKE
ncbi:MAG: triose-phosphate isomerase family protein [bacterium]|nr:triose-phosphate isomerase family protein [bacterium]